MHNKLLWSITDARRTNMSKYVPKTSLLAAHDAHDDGDAFDDDDGCGDDDDGRC